MPLTVDLSDGRAKKVVFKKAMPEEEKVGGLPEEPVAPVEEPGEEPAPVAEPGEGEAPVADPEPEPAS